MCILSQNSMEISSSREVGNLKSRDPSWDADATHFDFENHNHSLIEVSTKELFAINDIHKMC